MHIVNILDELNARKIKGKLTSNISRNHSSNDRSRRALGKKKHRKFLANIPDELSARKVQRKPDITKNKK